MSSYRILVHNTVTGDTPFKGRVRPLTRHAPPITKLEAEKRLLELWNIHGAPHLDRGWEAKLYEDRKLICRIYG